MNVDLPKNTKLVNTTWKDDQLWYLVRPMRENEKPEVSQFVEKSNMEVMEGKVVFKESK